MIDLRLKPEARPLARSTVEKLERLRSPTQRTIYSGAFGERQLDGGVAMTEDTVCNIASMTKAITGACAMQLVEQGKLDLDSPVSKWIPQAAELKVLAGWDGDKPVLRAPKTEMTLRHLMTHTTGMGYTLWSADLLKVAQATQPDGAFPALDYDDPATWVVQPLMFDPGTRLALRHLDRLDRPVGPGDQRPAARHLHAGQHLRAARHDQHRLYGDPGHAGAAGHHPPARSGRDDRPAGSAATADPPHGYGGGGLSSTVPDYQRFIRMILNSGSADGNQLLKPETVAEMSKNQMGDIRVKMLPTTDPALSPDAEFFPGLPKSWSLTFMINDEQAPTGRPAGSLAWAGFYNTFYWIDPVNKVGGVFMSQLLPFVDTKTLQAFSDFESAYYRAASA